MKKFYERHKKIFEALQIFVVLFIFLPGIAIAGVYLTGWIFANNWRIVIGFSLATGALVLTIAENEPTPKATVYRVLPTTSGVAPTIAPAAVQKATEPLSQQEIDKEIAVARMLTEHWYRISMGLLTVCGVLVALFGLALKGIIATH